jgi:hypothetical protein
MGAWVGGSGQLFEPILDEGHELMNFLSFFLDILEDLSHCHCHLSFPVMLHGSGFPCKVAMLNPTDFSVMWLTLLCLLNS